MVEKFSCLSIIVLIIKNKKNEGLKNMEMFFSHPTQHQRIGLVMRDSYELSRCIIAIYFIIIFRELSSRAIKIKKINVLDAMNLVISI